MGDLGCRSGSVARWRSSLASWFQVFFTHGKGKTGNEWSAGDVADLQQCAVLQTAIEEVREKASELDLPLQ
jgi:hypothetical protein